MFHCLCNQFVYIVISINNVKLPPYTHSCLLNSVYNLASFNNEKSTFDATHLRDFKCCPRPTATFRLKYSKHCRSPNIGTDPFFVPIKYRNRSCLEKAHTYFDLGSKCDSVTDFHCGEN